jgi:hypothetical protein
MGSALLFRLIAAHVAELTRSFDEAALPVRALLNGCGLVAERVNRLSGQIRRLASASSFGGPRWRGGGKGLLDQPADRLGPRGLILLLSTPAINRAQKLV